MAVPGVAAVSNETPAAGGQSQAGVSRNAYDYYKYSVPLTISFPITANGTWPQLLNVPGQDWSKVNVSGRFHHAYSVAGTFGGASIQLQGSLDGITWYNFGSPFVSTTTAPVEIDANIVWLQWVVTGATAPVLTLTVYSAK